MSRTSTKTWRAIVASVRQTGRAADLPCGICRGSRGPIDYRTAAEADRDARRSGEWWLLGGYRPLALSVDHVVPVVAGGVDDLTNAVQVHNVCNSTAGAKGHRSKRKPSMQAVTGYWKPLEGPGDRLPGRAVPGTRQGDYVFIAAPRGPLPPSPSEAGSLGIANTSSRSETPRGTE